MGGLILAVGDSGVCIQQSSLYDLFPKQVHNSIINDYGKTQFVNKGINGNTSAQMVNNIAWWSNFTPDLIICTIGPNDAVDNGSGPAVSIGDYTANLGTILNTFYKMNPNAAIVFCSAWHANLNKPGQLRPNATTYIAALEDFCAANGLTCAVLQNAWSESEWSLYTYDEIHPNAAGSALIHNIVYPIVKNVAANWLDSLKQG